MEHRVSYKIYYEDTDCLGMVYHANYLKYFERARTELVSLGGRDVREWNDAGFYIIVYSVEMVFRKAGLLGDMIDIVTHYSPKTPYRALFRQRAERAGEVLVEAEIELVCLDHERRLQPFPAILDPAA
ncbi:MAG TPA: hotdog domain-containing protein [Roseiflexaceae bacterium]|nr:hotdog domain-containing protein [Roseiflexaceae bacterium]HMP41311.1 hotdog domain-containing protein [Roseiflexaceae bacterium]